MSFTEKEKISAFDKISELYFKQNFGSTSKADLETLLFSEYIESRISQKLPFDDYVLSKELGLTQNRIRTLKERKELKYPHVGFDWRAEFAESVENAKYDKSNHRVKMIIQDVNVMNEIRHYIEKKGWYDECSLNKKLLCIPLDCFIEICSTEESLQNTFSEEAKLKISEIGKEDRQIAEFVSNFTKEGLKQFLMYASKEIILAVLPMLRFGGIAKTAFGFLEKSIKGA